MALTLELAGAISGLKNGLAGSYAGSAHLYEAVPKGASGLAGSDEAGIGSLHAFARANPIYLRRTDQDIAGAPCTVYEGDLNDHWLDSIKHDASCAPFYPTWMLSAYALAHAASSLGVKRAVDVGSGDGRIAHCCKAAGIEPLSVEIDGGLCRLQEEISSKTGVKYRTKCADAARLDYSGQAGSRAAFFIGGLPEVGEVLAAAVVERALSCPQIKRPVFVLAGSLALRSTARCQTKYGWGQLIDGAGLEILGVLVLPTRWTVEQPLGTPYVFASPS